MSNFNNLDNLSDEEINILFDDVINLPPLLAILVKGDTPSDDIECDSYGNCWR